MVGAGILGVGGTGALIAAVNDKYYETTQAQYRFRTWDEFLEELEGLLAGDRGRKTKGFSPQRTQRAQR